ncbi:hypothetical protein JXA02_10865 [candidate division KSB1 bacterium]|nr:hypothetical protein [candidate division KSB1 bacterium]
MQGTITLKQALSLWHDEMKKTTLIGKHIGDFDLMNIALGRKSGNRDILRHLLFCDECLQKYKEHIPEEKQDYAELAWKKAAAAETISWPQFLYSDDGTFKIEIRQSEESLNIGLITVEVVKNREQLEGREISVVDGKSKLLLKGVIKGGQVFRKIDNLADIDLRLLVRTIDQV